MEHPAGMMSRFHEPGAPGANGQEVGLDAQRSGGTDASMDFLKQPVDLGVRPRPSPTHIAARPTPAPSLGHGAFDHA